MLSFGAPKPGVRGRPGPPPSESATDFVTEHINSISINIFIHTIFHHQTCANVSTCLIPMCPLRCAVRAK